MKLYIPEREVRDLMRRTLEAGDLPTLRQILFELLDSLYLYGRPEEDNN